LIKEYQMLDLPCSLVTMSQRTLSTLSPT